VGAVCDAPKTTCALCRNGIWTPALESCDDGDSDDTNGCKNDCTIDLNSVCNAGKT
jgi:hypothetical protein